jgi:hypothetical protein
LKSQTKESKSMKQNKNHCVKIILSVGAIACVVALAGCAGTRSTQGGGGGVPADYKGKPWQDKAQVIPGKIHAAFYDLGGEGVAYHDTDPEINRGSGELNQRPEQQMPESSPYYWNFRKNEGVDISYTKKPFDKNVEGKTEQFNILYVGWTHPGEWLNYTVKVKKAGTYTINAHISAHGPDRCLSFDFNGEDKSGKILIRDTKGVHRWATYKNLGEVKLEKGLQVMTMHIVDNGDMNIDYVEFVPELETGEDGK